MNTVLHHVDRSHSLAQAPRCQHSLPCGACHGRCLVRRPECSRTRLIAAQVQPFIELCKADFRATRNYVLNRYPGRITLFRAAEELSGSSSDSTLGWIEWASEGADIHVVPGNHATMIYKPHVEVLAAKLQACLDQVREDEESAADTPSDRSDR